MKSSPSICRLFWVPLPSTAVLGLRNWEFGNFESPSKRPSKRSPSHATVFKAAQMALLDKFHTIDTISNVTDKQFSEMGIEDGLVTQFRTLLVKYQRKTLNHR